jgi:hypothetical protein
MPGDQMFQQILEGLQKELNPNVFELCAADLIREDFKTAVPVVGGNDGGMDGAIADFDGEPFPIVCTTQDDVIGNLTKSLDSYLKNGEQRRKVVLATSRSLTPLRQKNLRERARDKGFQLVQIYERQAIAERLLGNPRWCKELLNLMGNLPVLSKIAPHGRSEFSAAELTGREGDLEWLKKGTGHAIVTGQPGTGKTAVFMEFVKNENAYFLAGSNEAEITEAFRKLMPAMIVLDDAHTYLDKLDLLLRIRRELSADFRILAIAWPSKVEELKIKLGIDAGSTRELRLLTRDEIVTVIKNTGLLGPDQYIREIANQAEGKPGLAVLLTSLCLRGDGTKFWNGDLLSAYVLNSVEKATGKRVKEILAAFALGGDAGMSIATVADVLRVPPVEVSQAVAELDAAGIVSDNGTSLSVSPRTLQFALVRDVFFSGAKAIDPGQLLDKSPDFDETTLTLLGALHRGATVPENMLFERVMRSESEEIWSGFAWLGEYRTDRILTQHPERVTLILEPALEWHPTKTLPLLFEKAVGDNRPLNSATDHPLRKIEDWVSHASPQNGEASKVRAALLRGILDWLSSGGDPSVAFKVLPSVFSPNFGATNLDPGAGRTIQITRGTLGADSIREFFGLWDQLVNFLKNAKTVQWAQVVDTIEHLTVHHARELSEEARQVCKELTQKMIEDVSALVKDRPGVVRSLRNISSRFGLTPPAETDTVFSKLFPAYDIGVEDVQVSFENTANELAEFWKGQSPDQVADQILKAEAAAKEAEINWPRLAPHACYKLSQFAKDPFEWVTVFTSMKAPVDCVAPFLNAAIEKGDDRWIEFTKQHLNGPLQYQLVQVILLRPDCEKEMWEKIAPLLPQYLQTVEYSVGRMSVQMLSKVLEHSDQAVRGHAAVGEWNSAKFDKKRPIRAEVFDAWKSAIVNFDDDEHWLTEILSSDKALGFAWVKRRIENLANLKLGYESEKLLKSLCQSFSVTQRRELLNVLPVDNYNSRSIFRALVSNDMELSANVFANPKFKKLSIELARWTSAELWAERVLLLEKQGFSARDVSYNVLPTNRSWSGNESDMIKGWIQNLEPMVKHPKKFVAEVAAYVTENLNESLKRALDWEFQEAVYGRSGRRRR